MTRRLLVGLPAAVIALIVNGCWHEEQNHDLRRPNNIVDPTGIGTPIPPWTPKYIVVAGDGEGYVNLYGDDGAGKTQDYGAIQIKSDAGALPLGPDIHSSESRICFDYFWAARCRRKSHRRGNRRYRSCQSPGQNRRQRRRRNRTVCQ